LTKTPKGFQLPAGKQRLSMPRKPKPLLSADQLADITTASLLQGKSPHHDPKLGPATDADRRSIVRVTGEAIEVFNARISEKLRIICDKSADRIQEKLDQDAFKPGELGFIFSVAHDKRQSLDGNNQLRAASVNIQVNNYGPADSPSKEAILASLGRDTQSFDMIPSNSPKIVVISDAKTDHVDTESQQAQVVDATPADAPLPESQQAKP
jgi:hypothetical protein